MEGTLGTATKQTFILARNPLASVAGVSSTVAIAVAYFFVVYSYQDGLLGMFFSGEGSLVLQDPKETKKWLNEVMMKWIYEDPAVIQ